MFKQQINETAVQIEKLRKLIDQLYPERDASQDQEIYLFRNQVIEQLNILRRKTLASANKEQLNKFIQCLEAIVAEQDEIKSQLSHAPLIQPIIYVNSHNTFHKKSFQATGSTHVNIYIGSPAKLSDNNKNIVNFEKVCIQIIKCLRTHYRQPQYQKIIHISGETVVMKDYITLSITKHSPQQEREKSVLKQIVHTLNSKQIYETIYQTHDQDSIELSALFDEQPQKKDALLISAKIEHHVYSSQCFLNGQLHHATSLSD